MAFFGLYFTQIAGYANIFLPKPVGKPRPGWKKLKTATLRRKK